MLRRYRRVSPVASGKKRVAWLYHLLTALPQLKTHFTIDDYLAWEAEQAERHEFVNGEVFAMAGAGEGHNVVAGNFYIRLREHLSNSPCRTYMSDMKLRVAALNNAFYPDIMVTCDPADRESRMSKSEPKLIVEILSPSTANYDRGEKFVSYRQIASLREYVMVDIDKRQIEVYRLGDQGLWVLHPFDLRVAGAVLSLTSVDLALTAEQVFADVD